MLVRERMRTVTVKPATAMPPLGAGGFPEALLPAEPHEQSGSQLRTVLVVRSELLPYSETFVKEQVMAYSHWRAVLVGLRRVPGVPIDDLDVRLLPVAKSLPERAYRKLLAKLRVTPAGVRRLLGSETPDLIHVHFGTDAVEHWGWIEPLRIPVIVTLHGYDINIDKQWWQSPAKPRSQRRYPDLLLEVAANPRVHFVAVSNAIRARAIEWGLPPERISLRHIGVNPSSFRNTGLPVEKRAPRILFVGRLIEKKGVEYLIRAFAKVRTQVPHAELVLVGDGRLRGKLESLASALGVPVNFAGVLSSEQINQHLQSTRVFCSPSITADNGDAEGLPIVILEAQACGVPVVTSARGGAEEGIIHGVSGYGFEEKDVESLSRNLLRLLQDDALVASMSSAARRNIEQNFELRSCTAKLEELYDSWSRSLSIRAGAAA
jgi:glycosyltransferase involved in cell wall biosynthesis